MKKVVISNKKNTLIPFTGLTGGLYSMEGNKYGQNIALNSGFDLDASWLKENAGITISNGVAHFANVPANNALYQTTLTIGKRYKITFTVSNYVAGTIYVAAGTTVGTPRTSNGIFTEEIVCTVAGNLIIRNMVVNGTFDIDNVTCQEVLIPDNSGNGNDLSMFGAPVKSTIGSLPAMTYNGTTDFLQKSPSKLGTLTQFSIVFSVKRTWDSTSRTVYSAYTGTNYGFHVLLGGDGYLYVMYGSSIYFRSVKTYSGAVNLNFIITYNAGIVKIYENGVFLATTIAGSFPASIDFSTLNSEIGRWYSGTYTYMTGSISTFALMTYVLTDTEIQTISSRLLFLAQNIGKWSASDSSALGSEILSIADRYFSFDSGFWTKDTGIVIINNNLKVTNESSGRYIIQKTGLLTAGKTYQFTLQLNSVTGGGVKINSGNSLFGTTRTVAGTYVQTLTVNSSDIGLESVNTTTMDIGFFGIKEVSEKYTTLQDSNFLSVVNLPSGDISAISGVTAVDSTIGKYYDAANHLIYAPLPITLDSLPFNVSADHDRLAVTTQAGLDIIDIDIMRRLNLLTSTQYGTGTARFVSFVNRILTIATESQSSFVDLGEGYFLKNAGSIIEITYDKNGIRKTALLIDTVKKTIKIADGVGFKVGEVKEATVALDTTKYIELEINGSIYKVAVVA